MRYSHDSMLPEKAFQPRPFYGMTLEGGGSSSPAQPTQTSTLTIPEYAQPYMETLLGKSEALGSQPYQAYGGERLAEMDPLQQQAYQNVSGMQAPDFGLATGMAGAAGIAGLQAGQYQPGAFYAPMTEAERAGFDTFGQAQAQQYMSPFFQNVVDLQKSALVRDAEKAQVAGDLGAARTGTYGGARNVLAGTERERALLGQMTDVQAKGLQSAYENAQAQFERDQARRMMAQGQNLQYGMQSQMANQGALMDAQKAYEQSRQFGGNLGMQGLQAALQGASTMGQLGATEYQTAESLAKLQAQMGADQRAAQQQAKDIEYQDFITQQQFPYKQLGFQSDLLRGSADLAGKGGSTVYQAGPSLSSQIAGTGIGALSLSKLLG